MTEITNICSSAMNSNEFTSNQKFVIVLVSITALTVCYVARK